jgi:hypothetical protein
LIQEFYVRQLVEFQLVQWGKISNTKQSLSWSYGNCTYTRKLELGQILKNLWFCLTPFNLVGIQFTELSSSFSLSFNNLHENCITFNIETRKKHNQALNLDNIPFHGSLDKTCIQITIGNIKIKNCWYMKIPRGIVQLTPLE